MLHRIIIPLLCFTLAIQSQNPAPIIRVNTRLVQVNVIVHDKSGPVSNLTKDDFILLDRGKQRPIEFFSVDKRTAAQTETQPQAPSDIFTNRATGQTADRPGVTILLLDGLNTNISTQPYARQQVIKYLKQLNPDDHIAIYTLGSSLRVLQDFTRDSSQLLKVLGKYRGTSTSDLAEENPEPSNTGDATIDAMLDEMNQMFADQAQVNRTLRTLEALEAIASHVSQVPGRKNLVWVSGSFPLTIGYDDPSAFGNAGREQRTFSEERARTEKALNNANIAVYPVDARGLIATPDSMNAQSRGTMRGNVPPRAVTMIPKGHDTMDELASATGGKAFYNTNDLTGAIRMALEDSAVTYTLGFYPDSNALDGKFHELKVQLTQKGLNARYRKGYLAFKDEAPSDKQGHFLIQTALWSPLESTEIPLTGKVDKVDQPAPNQLKITIVADAHAVQIEQHGDKWTGAFDVIYGQRDKQGQILDVLKQTVNLNLQQQTYDGIMQKGMRLSVPLKPKDGLSQIRVVVYDHATGAIGSLQMPAPK